MWEKDQLSVLEDERFQSKRVFRKMSENMHYEIFKYMNFRELLTVRGTNLSGYQLTSNKNMRSRIKNYFIRDTFYPFLYLNTLIHQVTDYPKKFLVMVQQMGKEELNLCSMNIHEQECPKICEIFKCMPHLHSLNLCTYIDCTSANLFYR